MSHTKSSPSEAPSKPARGARRLAAIDLGSNSFRSLVGEASKNSLGVQVLTVETHRETVRLAAGLDDQQRLTPTAVDAALQALRRIGEQVRALQPEAVRCVATSTMRVAKNATQILPLAERALGYPIEVISGREEARLIYVGAAHSLPKEADNRLVVDIGGGSTECIIGKDYEALLTESVGVGSVALTTEFFPNGQITAKAIKAAVLAARARFAPLVSEYQTQGWVSEIGTSGTVKSFAQVVLERWGDEALTRKRLDELHSLAVKAGHVDDLDLDGLRDDRQAVFPGGLCALIAVFEAFGIQAMRYTTGALREGVLYDLAGDENQADMRDISARRLMLSHGVDPAATTALETEALAVLSLIEPDAGQRAKAQTRVRWACRFSEIGRSIAHDHYHKHSAYIIEHAELAGFSQTELHQVAALVLGHLGKLGKVDADQMDEANTAALMALRLTMILRRHAGVGALRKAKDALAIKRAGAAVKCAVSERWAEENALADSQLEKEVKEWKQAELPLQFHYSRF